MTLSHEELETMLAALAGVEAGDYGWIWDDDVFRALTTERDKASRLATDRMYFMQAYWQMLGPNALKVAAIWSENNVKRVHYSWGPEAHKLTGEERAQVILEAEDARKTAVRIDSVDSPSPPSIAKEMGK